MPSQSNPDAKAKRQAKLEAMRREQARKRRIRIGLLAAGAVVAAALVVVGIVAAVGANHGSGKPVAASQVLPAAPAGNPVTQGKATPVADTSGIEGVLAWDTTGWPGDGSAHAGALEHDHVDGPVKYAVTPPVGGPHNATWMNAGVYTKPIPSERAVHNLEHGAVWITYSPTLSAADVKSLTAFVTRQSLIPESQQATGIAGEANRFIDLSPWANASLPSPIVISSWGHQLRVSSPSDPRLQKFVDTFRESKIYSPELGEPVDGIPTGIGGVPSADGAKVPNPTGN
jgi:hypothetical protein